MGGLVTKELCPFCGEPPRSGKNDDGYFVGCFNRKCPVKPMTVQLNYEEAIAAWNLRDRPIKLKPCPFCGEDARFGGIMEGFIVTCTNPDCKMATGCHINKRDAARNWNRRWGDGSHPLNCFQK